MVDLDEGTSLKFILALVINGVKCAKIKTSNVGPKIEYWQSTVLSLVLGANPPLEVIEGYIYTFGEIWI